MKARRSKIQEQIYQIKVGLLEISPLVWRRFLIPSNVSLHRLHLVLQDVIGWHNYHLYRFQIGNNEYSVPEPDNNFRELDFKDSKRAKLGKLVKEKKGIFIYEYDFGDGWEHQLLIEDILTRDLEKHYPVCLDGENSCPPEDCGGTHGYAEMMEIIRNPTHPEYKNVKIWLGRSFNPRKFDLELVNKRLFRMLL